MEPLLEREDEQGAIDALLDAAQDGRGGALYLEGEAGIGKSSLLESARARGRDMGLRTLRASGSPLAQGVAYAVVRELLLGEVSGDDEIWQGAAKLARPALLDAKPEMGPPSPETTLAVRQGLVWLVSALANRGAPLVLIADDLHWADPASVRFLSALAARVEDLPIALLGAARPAAAWADRGLAAEVTGATRIVRPARLSDAAVAEALARRLGSDPDPSFVAEVVSQTAGTPYLVEALAAALARRGIEPSAANAPTISEQGLGEVADEAVRRVHELDPGAQAIARAVAIVGDGRSVADAERVADVKPGTALRSAESLEAAGLLRGWPEPGFEHPLVRSAVLDDLGTDGRAELHARAARLAMAGGETARAAAHLGEAPPSGDPAAAEVLVTVGGRALRSGAPDVAARHLRRALEEPPPGPLLGPALFELGLAELELHDPVAPDRLAAAARALALPELKLRALMVSGHALSFQGLWDEAFARMDEALRAGGDASPDDLLVARIEQAVFMLTCVSWGREARERLSILDREVEQGSPMRPLVDGALSLAAVSAGRSRQEVLALVDASRRGMPPQTAGGPLAAVPSIALVLADAFAEADAFFEAFVASARLRLDIAVVRMLSGWQALGRLRQGRLAAAEEACLAIEAVDAATPGLPDLLSATVLASVALERGDLEAAARHADQEFELEQSLADLNPLDDFLVVRARVRLAQGQPAEAVRLASHACGRQTRWGGTSPPVSQWRLVLAAAESARDDDDRARDLVAEELREAEEFGAPRPIAMTRRLAAAVGPEEESEQHLREALAALEGEPLDLLRAHVQADLGSRLAVDGRPEDAKTLLRAALEVAWGIGADPLADRCRGLLAQLGSRPRRPELTGARSLTAAEARTARLAAGGMSNRELAEHLFVTEKTVETHLTASYRKLGIAGRGELAAALGEEEPALAT